jgi:hypothetical protein
LIFDKKIVIQAKDLKWSNYLEKMGGMRFSNALGLTEESKEMLRDKIKPIIIEKIRHEL